MSRIRFADRSRGHNTFTYDMSYDDILTDGVQQVKRTVGWRGQLLDSRVRRTFFRIHGHTFDAEIKASARKGHVASGRDVATDARSDPKRRRCFRDVSAKPIYAQIPGFLGITAARCKMNQGRI